MKDRLRHFVTHELLSDPDGASIDDDDNLLGSGLVDSVGMMALVLFIEEEWDLHVPPHDVTIEHFLSINTIDAYLKQRQT